MTATPSARWLWLLPEARRALETRELAVILRFYRKFAGLSQVAMGELLGYDPSYVSLLERRQRTINDRQGLLHISRILGVPPHALGITSDEDADFLAALQFGESTVRLAEIARQAGRAAEAVEELWPLVVRLEARLSEGRVDYGTATLLARARATLGTSLGHVLPEEQLYLAARWTGGAMRIARHLDDGDFLGHVLRMHGNELRKAGRAGSAIAHPRHRRRGITRELLRSVRSQAEVWGCRRLYLTSEPGNEVAHASWAALGFVNVSGDREVDGVSVITDFKGRGRSRAVYELLLS